MILRWFPLVVIALVIFSFEADPKRKVRAAVATFTVTTHLDNVNDANCTPESCTLRQALNAANANGNPTDIDEIRFNIPGDGVKVISVNSLIGAFPAITQPILLDGTSQPGASCAPRTLLIEIVGIYQVGMIGLEVEHAAGSTALGSTIQGVAVRNTATGVWLGAGTNHRVRCSNVGLTAAGTIPGFYGNSANGIVVRGNAVAALIGGTAEADRNIISGNSQYGLQVQGDGTLVYGNWIGVGPDGVTPAAGQTGGVIGNTWGGILVIERSFQTPSTGVRIGSASSAARNVISGNQGLQASGINVAGSNDLRIVGNYIGVGADGTTPAGNTVAGILADANYDDVPIEGLSIAGNVLSANGADGIRLNPGVAAARLTANRIGTNAAGTGALGNAGHGIRIFSLETKRTNGTTIGLSGNNDGNIISGNGGSGIEVQGWADDTKISANTIGYAADRTTPLPNGVHGIRFFATQPQTGGYIGAQDSYSENWIYAEAAGDALGNGIVLQETQAGTPTRVEIGRNRITSEGHGIDLYPYYNTFETGPNQVTPNDTGDEDGGPNGRQNHPDQMFAQPGDPSRVNFRLITAPGDYTVRFYASATCDSNTSRQAHRYLSSFSFTVVPSTQISGGLFIAINHPLGSPVAAGEYVTATATKTNGADSGDTSELSPCAQAGVAADATISALDPDQVVAGTGTFTFDVTGTNLTSAHTVTWNGQALPTTLVNATTLSATATRANIGMTMGEAAITVTGAGGFETAPLEMTILRSSSDVDCDGTATAADALLTLRALAGFAYEMTDCQVDPNQDGELLIDDVLWIRRDIAGLIANPLEMNSNR